MIKLKVPISEEQIRKLKVGDEVLLSGIIVTARDQAHKLMVEEKPDFIRKDLKESVIYHCGPVVKKEADGSWSFVSAGPTTSIREEPYQADVICEYNVRGVIGNRRWPEKMRSGLFSCGWWRRYVNSQCCKKGKNGL
jgi:fumarate hydratase subunit beta